MKKSIISLTAAVLLLTGCTEDKKTTNETKTQLETKKEMETQTKQEVSKQVTNEEVVEEAPVETCKSSKENKEEIVLVDNKKEEIESLLSKSFDNEKILFVENIVIPNSPMELSIIEIEKTKQRFPIYSSKDGTFIFPFTPQVMMKEPKNFEVVVNKLQEVDEYNAPIIEKMKAEQEELKQGGERETFKKLYNIIKDNLGEEQLLTLSENNNAEEKIIVIDPECPWCKKKLEDLTPIINDTNIKLIFAPVHKKSSWIKSELIIQQWKNLSTPEEKLELLKKYFSNYKITDEERNIDTTQIEKNIQVIFKTGIVTGVPFEFPLIKE